MLSNLQYNLIHTKKKKKQTSSRAGVRALPLIPCSLVSWCNNRIRFCFGLGGLLFCYLGVSVIDVTASELNVLTFNLVAL